MQPQSKLVQRNIVLTIFFLRCDVVAQCGDGDDEEDDHNNAEEKYRWRQKDGSIHKIIKQNGEIGGNGECPKILETINHCMNSI